MLRSAVFGAIVLRPARLTAQRVSESCENIIQNILFSNVASELTREYKYMWQESDKKPPLWSAESKSNTWGSSFHGHGEYPEKERWSSQSSKMNLGYFIGSRLAYYEIALCLSRDAGDRPAE